MKLLADKYFDRRAFRNDTELLMYIQKWCGENLSRYTQNHKNTKLETFWDFETYEGPRDEHDPFSTIGSISRNKGYRVRVYALDEDEK